ncbi:hypothetical protein [Streptomyces cucumeris]
MTRLGPDSAADGCPSEWPRDCGELPTDIAPTPSGKAAPRRA